MKHLRIIYIPNKNPKPPDCDGLDIPIFIQLCFFQMAIGGSRGQGYIKTISGGIMIQIEEIGEDPEHPNGSLAFPQTLNFTRKQIHHSFIWAHDAHLVEKW